MTDESTMVFGSLLISYDPAGLRPRPWTELQSTWAAELLRELPEGDVLELGAGVGHIGLLALARADERSDGPVSGRRLVQVDEEETVCRLAERNAGRADLSGRVEVRCGGPEDCLRPDERFVLVVADPPWVPSDQVTDHPDDPPPAIDGGPDGLDVVRAFLPLVERHLHPAGAALLQVGGPDQVEQVRTLLESRGSGLRLTGSRRTPGGQQGAVALLVPRGQGRVGPQDLVPGRAGRRAGGATRRRGGARPSR